MSYGNCSLCKRMAGDDVLVSPGKATCGKCGTGEENVQVQGVLSDLMVHNDRLAHPVLTDEGLVCPVCGNRSKGVVWAYCDNFERVQAVGLATKEVVHAKTSRKGGRQPALYS